MATMFCSVGTMPSKAVICCCSRVSGAEGVGTDGGAGVEGPVAWVGGVGVGLGDGGDSTGECDCDRGDGPGRASPDGFTTWIFALALDDGKANWVGCGAGCCC